MSLQPSASGGFLAPFARPSPARRHAAPPRGEIVREFSALFAGDYGPLQLNYTRLSLLLSEIAYGDSSLSSDVNEVVALDAQCATQVALGARSAMAAVAALGGCRVRHCVGACWCVGIALH